MRADGMSRMVRNMQSDRIQVSMRAYGIRSMVKNMLSDMKQLWSSSTCTHLRHTFSQDKLVLGQAFAQCVLKQQCL